MGGDGWRSGSGGALQSRVFHSKTDASWPRVSSQGLRTLGAKAKPLTGPLKRESTATWRGLGLGLGLGVELGVGVE